MNFSKEFSYCVHCEHFLELSLNMFTPVTDILVSLPSISNAPCILRDFVHSCAQSVHSNGWANPLPAMPTVNTTELNFQKCTQLWCSQLASLCTEAEKAYFRELYTIIQCERGKTTVNTGVHSVHSWGVLSWQWRHFLANSLLPSVASLRAPLGSVLVTLGAGYSALDGTPGYFRQLCIAVAEEVSLESEVLSWQ